MTLAVTLAACGGAAPRHDPAVRLSAGEVVRRFDAETGLRLRRAGPEDPAWEQLGLGLDVPRKLLRRYGVFSIYVVKPGHARALVSLLSDKTTGAPLERGPGGVFWERDTQSGGWIAYRRYGANVVLVWFGEDEARATDDRFDRIARIMRRVVQTPPSG